MVVYLKLHSTSDRDSNNECPVPMAASALIPPLRVRKNFSKIMLLRIPPLRIPGHFASFTFSTLPYLLRFPGHFDCLPPDARAPPLGLEPTSIGDLPCPGLSGADYPGRGPILRPRRPLVHGLVHSATQQAQGLRVFHDI